MNLFHEKLFFETVKSKVITSLFEIVRLLMLQKNLYNSLKSIKEIYLTLLICLSFYFTGWEENIPKVSIVLL